MRNSLTRRRSYLGEISFLNDFPMLADAKGGHLILIIFKELLEVEKLALCRFWAKINWRGSAWTDGSLEHKIEWNRWEHLAIAVRISNIQSLNQLSELRPIVIIYLELYRISISHPSIIPAYRS
jgi:hypothetical protein